MQRLHALQAQVASGRPRAQRNRPPSAIAAAEAEVDGFIGGDPSAVRWPDPESIPGDVKASAMMLVRLHFEESNAVQAELWRGIAQRLLVRYRTDSGIGGA